MLARYGAAVLANPDAAPEATPTAAAVAIDRAALGRLVFADAAERQWLEQLIHPPGPAEDEPVITQHLIRFTNVADNVE